MTTYKKDRKRGIYFYDYKECTPELMESIRKKVMDDLSDSA